MKLKKFPRRPMPEYSQDTWNAFEFQPDHKLLKHLKFFNKLIIRIAKATPDNAEPLEEFNALTELIDKSLKKILKTPDLPTEVEEYCFTFRKKIKLWRRVTENPREAIAEAKAAMDELKKRLTPLQNGLKAIIESTRIYTELIDACAQATKELGALEKLLRADKTTSKLDAVLKKLESGDLAKRLETRRTEAGKLASKAPNPSELKSIRELATESEDEEAAELADKIEEKLQKLASLADTANSEVDAVKKRISAILAQASRRSA